MNTYDPNYVPTYARFLLGVKIIVIGEDGKILIIKRSDKVDRPHGWDFPGGGVDKSEEPSVAATREVKEETSLNVSDLQILTTYLAKTDGEDDLIIGYVAKVDSSDVKLVGWEHEEFRWISIEEMATFGLPECHMSIFKAYRQLLKKF